MVSGSGGGAAAAFVDRGRHVDASRLQRRREAEHEAGRDRDGDREHQRGRIDARSRRRPARWRRRASPAAAPPRSRAAAPEAAAAASRTLSTNICIAIRRRLAPIAVRIAISFCRPTARASSRLATLEHAISSTNPTAATSTSSDCRTFCTAKSCSGFTSALTPWLNSGYCVGQPFGDDVHLGLRLLEVDARLHPRDRKDAGMPAAIVRQRRRPRPDRQEDIGRLQQLEPRRQDADDRVRLVVERDRAADRGCIAAEPPAPQRVGQQHDACRAGRSSSAVKVRPIAGATPQHRQQRGADHPGRDAIGLAIAGHRHRQAAHRGDGFVRSRSGRASRRSSASSSSRVGNCVVRSSSITS